MSMPAWSYSSLTSYETCPKRYYLTRVARKVREPQSEAIKWGNEVHKALELRLKNGTPLPDWGKDYETYCVRIESHGGEVFTEQEIALDKNFRQTGWWDKSCWCRMKIDVNVKIGSKAVLLDWKTGKPKPDSDQLKMSAVAVMQTDPDIENVTTGFVWLAYGKLDSAKFTRDDISGIWQEFMPRVRRLEIAYDSDKWEAKPSGLCKAWCPVGRGLCEFCGKD